MKLSLFCLLFWLCGYVSAAGSDGSSVGSSQSSSHGSRIRGARASDGGGAPPKEVAVLEGDDAQAKGVEGGPKGVAKKGSRYEADAAGYPKFDKMKGTGALGDWSIPSVIDFGGDLDPDMDVELGVMLSSVQGLAGADLASSGAYPTGLLRMMVSGGHAGGPRACYDAGCRELDSRAAKVEKGFHNRLDSRRDGFITLMAKRYGTPPEEAGQAWDSIIGKGYLQRFNEQLPENVEAMRQTILDYLRYWFGFSTFDCTGEGPKKRKWDDEDGPGGDDGNDGGSGGGRGNNFAGMPGLSAH